MANPLGRPASTLPLEANSVVRSVTVFRDRAAVTRVLREPVERGLSTLVFEGLPFVLMPDSLGAAVENDGVEIVGVELVSGTSEVQENERSDALRAEAKTLTDELGQIRDRLEALLAQRAYLRTTLLSGPVDGQGRQDLGEVRATLGYVGEAEQGIAKQLRELAERAGELDEALGPLLVKLENPLATGQTVRVELDAEAPGEVQVALRYLVHGASWGPAYNARLTGGRMEFEYQGVVSQGTGEDWSDVELLLSTANPSVAGSMPELRPWYLGRDGWAGGDVGAALDTGRGYHQAPSDPAPPGAGGVLESRMDAAVESNGAVVFAVPGRRSVAGDGSAQRIPVGTQTFATTVELAAAPKLAPGVFRRARVSYGGSVPLLPGPVATYVDGDYVGASSLPAVVPGEEFELAFGTDERVKVERQLLSRRQELLGPGKNTVRYTFHFRVRVSNFSGDSRIVEVTDQLPISELDRVVVKALALADGDVHAPDPESGRLEWQVDVADGAQEEVEFRFSVTAPVGTPELRAMEMLF